jgi:Ycf4
MNQTIIRENIVGARNLSSYIIMAVLLSAGLGFFLAGLSSYFHINLIILTDTSQISFIPQGIALLFYGTGAIGLGLYILLTIFLNIGSGYNEFSKVENIVRIVRLGFPGKNRQIFLSYEFKSPMQYLACIKR